MGFSSLPSFATFKPQFMALVGCTICILCNELKSEKGIEWVEGFNEWVDIKLLKVHLFLCSLNKKELY